MLKIVSGIELFGAEWRRKMRTNKIHARQREKESELEKEGEQAEMGAVSLILLDWTRGMCTTIEIVYQRTDNI